MPQVKNQQSHSLHLILAFFIFVTTIFRFCIFALESLSKIHEKCDKMGEKF